MDYYQTYWRTDVRIASITASSAIYLYCRDRSLAAPLPLIALLSGIALNIEVVPDTIKYTAGTLLIAISVGTIEKSRFFVKALSSNALVYVGVVSYSLYLWQQPFFTLAQYYHYSTLLMFSLAIGCGMLSFYLIERPTRRYLAPPVQ